MRAPGGVCTATFESRGGSSTTQAHRRWGGWLLAGAWLLAACGAEPEAGPEPAAEEEPPPATTEEHDVPEEPEAGPEDEPDPSATGPDADGFCTAVAAFQDAGDAAMDSAWPAHVEGDAPDPAGVQAHAEHLRAAGAAVVRLGDHLDDRFDPLVDALFGAYVGLADWYDDIDYDLDRLDDFDRLDAILEPLYELDEGLFVALEQRVMQQCPDLPPLDGTTAPGSGP